MKKLIALFVLALVVGSSTALSQAVRLQIPVRPKREECIAIHNADRQIAESIFSQMSACQNNTNPSPFRTISRVVNMLPDSSADCAATRMELTPWPRCSSNYEAALCEARAQTKSRFQTCISRATAVEAEERAAASEQEQRSRLLRDYNDTWDRIDDIGDTLSDPLRLTRDITARDAELGEQLNSRPDVAVELTRFTRRYTSLSLDAATRDPIIRTIQGESFNRLFQHVERLNSDLSTMNRMMEQFRTDIAASGARPLPPPLPQRNFGNAANQCDILRNPDRSRDLMARDPGAWAVLNRSCPR